MAMGGRKEKILQAVVDSYISTASPVSSSELRDKYFDQLSSATLRNELAALEDMGYLAQPHTSSGRVPTAEAYKLYVERLMPKRRLTREELGTVKRYFNRKITEIDEVLKNTAKVISEITNLTSVAYVGNLDEAVIRSIKFVKIDESTALVVIVTDIGILKDATVQMGFDAPESFFDKANEFVSEAFCGLKIGDIVGAKAKRTLKDIKAEYQALYNTIYRILKDYHHDEMASELVLEGSSKILEQPEYTNLTKAKAMLDMLDAKKQLVPVLRSNDDLSLSIKIGRDNELTDGLPECAIVTASITAGGKSMGSAGVIGPIRMDYAKVVSVLDYISRALSNPDGLLESSDDNIEDNSEDTIQ